MEFKIIGYQRCTLFEEVTFIVDADSPEAAMDLVKEDPDKYHYEVEYIDSGNYEYIDSGDWKITTDSLNEFAENMPTLTAQFYKGDE